MSRSRTHAGTTRAGTTRAGAPRARTTRAGPRPTSPRGRELQSARQRARVAKAVLATVGALVFGVAMAFARHSYAGHPKQPASALSADPQFVSIVRRDVLQAGIVAPAQAPPDATTAVS